MLFAGPETAVDVEVAVAQCETPEKVSRTPQRSDINM